jgi:hypothetical protein
MTYPLILCAGMVRSASTWIFNVVREIVQKRKGVEFIYADSFDQNAFDVFNGNPVVLKSHWPDAGITILAKVLCIPVIVSIRDPLDCVASLTARDAEISVDAAIESVFRSSEAMLLLQQRFPASKVIRYENVNRMSECVCDIARFISEDITEEEGNAIAEKLSLGNVTKIIHGLASEGVFGLLPNFRVLDSRSQWHYNHVGDGRSGKYDNLSIDDLGRAFLRLRAVRKALGYEIVRDRLKTSVELDFLKDGCIYCDEGFVDKDPSGVWTIDKRAVIVLPLERPIKQFHMTLHGLVGPALRYLPENSFQIRINGNLLGELSSRDLDTEQINLVIYSDIMEDDQLMIELSFKKLVTPQSLGINEDVRLLGLCLRRMKLTCV